MAIKFQYNKTSLQQLEKQLKVRVRTLPIIKNKESALRMEVKRCKTEAAELEERLEKQIQAYEAMFALWNEFDASLIKVSDVHLGIKKIAGVRVPLLENVDFDIRPYSLFNSFCSSIIYCTVFLSRISNAFEYIPMTSASHVYIL